MSHLTNQNLTGENFSIINNQPLGNFTIEFGRYKYFHNKFEK